MLTLEYNNNGCNSKCTTHKYQKRRHFFLTGKGWVTKALEEAIVAQETNGNEYNQTCQIPLLTEKIKEKLNHKKK